MDERQSFFKRWAWAIGCFGLIFVCGGAGVMIALFYGKLAEQSAAWFYWGTGLFMFFMVGALLYKLFQNHGGR